jgi:acetyl-CoA carboxylase biotin carboxyl carrier protein
LVAVHSSSVIAQATNAALPASTAETTANPTAGTKPGATNEEALHIVKSPIVGTFYESPSPGAPPFVKPGDSVESGQVLCIIEAMKLMNEIEADMSGEIVKRLVANGQPVEYGQPLFSIRPHSASA